ncbi:MAG: hypothetical protein V3T05_11910 [Myxococcota bacterium]
MAVATAILLEAPESEARHRRIEELQGEVSRLQDELLRVRTRTGELDLPSVVQTETDARVWLEWAGLNHHTEGCSCHRCPPARRMLHRL